jgi:hypothetical protein
MALVCVRRVEGRGEEVNGTQRCLDFLPPWKGWFWNPLICPTIFYPTLRLWRLWDKSDSVKPLLSGNPKNYSNIQWTCFLIFLETSDCDQNTTEHSESASEASKPRVHQALLMYLQILGFTFKECPRAESSDLLFTYLLSDCFFKNCLLMF